MREVRPGRRCAAALLVTERGHYLMQHRDAFAWIDFPDHWACFGGNVEPGENAEAAMRREVLEELAYAVGSATLFTEHRVLLPFPEPRLERVSFFVAPIREDEVPGMVLSGSLSRS